MKKAALPVYRESIDNTSIGNDVPFRALNRGAISPDAIRNRVNDDKCTMLSETATKWIKRQQKQLACSQIHFKLGILTMEFVFGLDIPRNWHQLTYNFIAKIPD